MNWALDGLDRLNERKRFKEPESSEAARTTLAAGTSPIAAFLEERCYLSPDVRVPVEDLYQAWREWCEADERKPGSKENFAKLLFSAAPSVSPTRPLVNGKKVRMYSGIALGEDPSLCAVCGTPMTSREEGFTTHPNCG